MKKIGKIFLVLMFIGLLCKKESYFASESIIASGQCGDSIMWTLDSDGHMKLSGTGEVWKQPTVQGSAQSLWGGYADRVITLEIQEGITVIRSCGDLKNLKHVEFPNTLKSIADYTFWGCSKLENFVLPNSLKGLGQQAFDSCSSLTSVTIPDSVTFLSVYVFDNCENLEYLYIGGQAGGYTYSTYQPIGSVPALEKFEVSPNHPAFSTRDGVLYTKDGTCMIEYPDGKKDRKYKVPEGTLEISGGAICGVDYLEEIILPEGLLVLGDGAISGCDGLKSVIIPSTLTTASADRTGSISNCYNIDYIENRSNIIYPLDWNHTIWLDENGNQVQGIGKGKAYQYMKVWDLWSRNKVTMKKGESLLFNDYITYYATGLVNYGGMEDLIFESSDTSVATVSKEGVVKAVGYGTATITITPRIMIEYGAEATTCTIVVSSPESSSELEKPGGSEKPNESEEVGESEKAGESEVPSESEKLNESEDSSELEKPNESGKPSESEKPSESQGIGKDENNISSIVVAISGIVVVVVSVGAFVWWKRRRMM